MELGKIIFSNHINQRFEELVFILHFNDYFSYQSNAIDYVDKIYDFINNDIYTFPHKISPKELLHLGSKYIFYRPNQRSTWYVFFRTIK